MSGRTMRLERFLYLALLLPAAALALGEAPAREAVPREEAPRSDAEVAASIERGAAFLLSIQNRDGSWGSPRGTKGLNIYAPAPGAHHAFRAAVTSLCIAALIEAGGPGEAVRKAIDRGEAWMLANLPALRRATPDAIYNVWGHGYAIQALVRLWKRRPEGDARRPEIERLIRGQIELLERYESVDGGWGYYDFRAGAQKPTSDSTSFTSATILVAFHEAREIGVEPPPRLVKRAVDSIVRQRKPDFSYLYAEDAKWRPMWEINRHGGSLGRSQACNLALRLWGDEAVTDGVLRQALERLIARNLWLDMGRKRPIPHESWFLVAGYFFYYGHYYAALCLERLPPAGRRPIQESLAGLLLPLQEKDGSWWDFPFYDYHRQYGTAFALMALHRCRRP